MPEIPFSRNIPLSLQDFRDEFDRLVDRVWHVGLKTAPLDGQDWAPSVDVIDEGGSYHLRVELPGLSADDVQVSILENRVSIQGVKPGPVKGEEHPRYLRKECRFGSFCRRYELPGPVEDDGITATYKRGVLDLVIRKKPEEQGRAVKVESED
ncbi:MAG: Hsp20/alpha crystallin family protein [Planctomycetota bacterium]